MQMDGSVLVRHCRPERLKALDMLIDRSWLKIAASRQSDGCLFEPAEERSHHVIRGAQLLHGSVRHRDGDYA
ncbi:hypothetical protein D3C76_1683520 [compost metagenome]